MTQQDVLSGSWEALHGLMVMITCVEVVLLSCVQKGLVSFSQTESWTAAEQLLIRQGNWHFYCRYLPKRKKDSDAWSGCINMHKHTDCPILINKFLGSKGTHSAALQHELCLCFMGKSKPISFTSAFWLREDAQESAHIHGRDKVHLNKGLQYHSALKSPSKPAPWENLDLKT